MKRDETRRIEAPNAPNKVGSGEGCPLPRRLGSLGERRELPQLGPGRSPGRKRILVVFLAHRTHLAVRKMRWLRAWSRASWTTLLVTGP